MNKFKILNQQLHNKGVLEALAYFDVFAFPLTKEEILKYSHYSNSEELDNSLSELLEKGLIYQFQDFYSLRKDSELKTRREENSDRAKGYLYQAAKKSKLISQFPFVKGVFISGSLSKGVMDEDGDIDFFIVTKSDRLWVARTLLILYKKIFLLNSRKYFCINYLVDENSLEIEQKNRFTAVELLSLYPMVDDDMHQEIIDKNKWVKDFFLQNYQANPEVKNLNNSSLKSTLEKVLSGSVGDRLDDFFMKVTLKRWLQKFGKMSEVDFDIALKTSKKVSKHHPSNFQKKVLSAYEERIATLQLKMAEMANTTVNQS